RTLRRSTRKLAPETKRSISESRAAEPSASEPVSQAPVPLRTTRNPAAATATRGVRSGSNRGGDSSITSAGMLLEQRPRLDEGPLLLDHQLGHRPTGEQAAQDLPRLRRLRRLVLQEG